MFSCTGTEQSLGCSEIGIYQDVDHTWFYLIGRTPSSARITVKSDGATVLDHSVQHIAYTVNQPNGPDCSPTCRNATVEI